MAPLQLRKPRVRLVQLLFDLNCLAVAKLGRLGEVGCTLGALGVGANLLELGLEGANLGDDVLLLVPARAQTGAPLVQPGELLLEPRQAFL